MGRKKKSTKQFSEATLTPLLKTELNTKSENNISDVLLLGFVICRHVEYGYLILQRLKVETGKIFQLPGGKSEPEDFDKAQSRVEENVARITACRELFEETGINVFDNLDRLIKLREYNIGRNNAFFFELIVTNNDEPKLPDPNTTDLVFTVPTTKEPFKILLSSEHSGFCFVTDSDYAAELIKGHSKGECMIALNSYSNYLNQQSKKFFTLDVSDKLNSNIERKGHKEPHKSTVTISTVNEYITDEQSSETTAEEVDSTSKKIKKCFIRCCPCFFIW